MDRARSALRADDCDLQLQLQQRTSVQPNPTPIITALFPASITAGSQSFTLFIAGTGFIRRIHSELPRRIGTDRRVASTVNLNTNKSPSPSWRRMWRRPGTAASNRFESAPGRRNHINAATFQFFRCRRTPSDFQPQSDDRQPKGAAFTITVNGANFVDGSADSLCTMPATAAALRAPSLRGTAARAAPRS